MLELHPIIAEDSGVRRVRVTGPKGTLHSVSVALPDEDTLMIQTPKAIEHRRAVMARAARKTPAIWSREELVEIALWSTGLACYVYIAGRVLAGLMGVP